MSNLQLTGADPHRTVNPQPADNPNSSFDALIDLLASDDIAGADSHPSHSPHHTVQLRDTSGKLAFDKIHLMFATQNLDPDRINNVKSSDTHYPRAQHGSDIQDVLSRSGLSRSVSPSSQSSERRGQGSRLASASSSAPLDQIIQSTSTQTQHSSSSARYSSSPDELVRIRSDEQFSLSRDEPMAQIAMINSVPCDKISLLHRGSSTENATTGLTEIAPLTEPSPSYAGSQDLTKPLEFEQLNGALSRATSEIDSLRERYEKLRVLVTERLSPLNGLQTGKLSAQPSGNHTIPSSQAHIRGPEFDQLEEISSLSESEAKNILTALVTSLRLSPRSVINLVSKFSDEGPVCPHPSSVDDIRSSMEFLARIDELVWRRSMLADDNGPDLLYSRANTDALIERLALWEKTIRRHHKG